MLERFRQAKAGEIALLRELRAQGRMPSPFTGKRPDFCSSLRAPGRSPLIAEYKRASPSRGDLNLAATPEDSAQAYADAGAGAISVLTEEHFFKGHLSYLTRCSAPGLPLLRKDFILHPLQVAQTAATPASALLLIARMLEEKALAALLAASRDFGLEAVTEVFDWNDLQSARRAGADIIQVNNRDLERLETDLSRSRHLVRNKKPGEFWISASGIEKPEQLDELLGLGFDAALAGSCLMSSGKPGEALAALLQGVRAKGQGGRHD